MKKYIIPILFVYLYPLSMSAEGITFLVEDLEKPTQSLITTDYDNLWRNLILSDYDLTFYQVERDSLIVPYEIVATGDAPEKLVTYGYNSFFNGMYRAYSEHCPFVLSPDMIWLLISQGFANHINSNAEELRHLFVNFEGKRELIVQNDKIDPDWPDSPWEEIFPEFINQISKYTMPELTDIFDTDFSTTTITEKIASQITLMDAFKEYFEFIILRVACGIPEITLLGTPDDWEDLRARALRLAKYGLEWWISEIDPLLEQFTETSRGNIDTQFWMNMFKIHSKGGCGMPDTFDGWIIKFFPYDTYGKRNDLQKIVGIRSLPSEIVKVDLKHRTQEPSGNIVKETQLELWAGFIGLEQDEESFSLTPRIGWMIRKKDTEKM